MIKESEPRFKLEKDSVCYGCEYYKSIDEVDFDYDEEDVSEGGICDASICSNGSGNKYREATK